jgi:CxxC motif-containing protein (DUF1111 family)
MKFKNLYIILLLLLSACSENDTSSYKSTKDKQKVKNYFTLATDKHAIAKPAYNLSNDETDIFYLGRSVFKTPWITAPSITTARDGLGPLFSANTCRNCHPNNGAGVAIDKNGNMSRSLLLRLSHKESNNSEVLRTNGFEPDSTYGAQFSSSGSRIVKPEGQSVVNYTSIKGKYPDGTNYELRNPTYSIKHLGYGDLDKETILAPRIGSALIGLGLLERIAEKDILAHEDINDSNHDGISGKANYAFDPESNTTRLGRFTWKASATSVKHQSAAAAHNDMGLSNPLFPFHNCTKKQVACLKEAALAEDDIDLVGFRLDALTFYVSNLTIPSPREVKKNEEGKKLFQTLNCVACHVPSYITSDGIKIQPYSDLLVHDMGEALADGRSEFLANGSEWRTAPMWGIGLYKQISGEANYLHDGRARSIEEAILWHGGEAQKSKDDFMALDKKSRQKVLNFLHSI